MTYKILIADDEATVVTLALQELFLQYEQKKITLFPLVTKKPAYELCCIDLEQAMELAYWDGLEIEHKDIVVLDYHYQKMVSRTSNQPVGLAYNGGTIVSFLHKQKERGNLLGLQTILMWTSDEKVINPRTGDPSFILAEYFDVYGITKGRDFQGKTILPAEGLVQYLQAIYADPTQKKIKPLNYGWRDEGIEGLLKGEKRDV